MSPLSGSAEVVHVVLPGDVDDLTAPSGGNIYDRRVCQGLAAIGVQIQEIAIPGSWPRPDATALAELARRLGELPDAAMVLLDGLVACGVPDIVVPHAGRLRMVVLVHLPLADEAGLEVVEAAELDAAEREVLRAATAVVATSAWAVQRLIDHHGLAADRVHAVVPGTDPAPLAVGGDGASRLLCVASLTPRKGQDLLVEALATVTDLTWSCDFVGPLNRNPAYVAELRKQVKRHRLGDRVQLDGPRTGESLASAYSAADLLVLPSRAETYGMVLTEALAHGIPVLATAVTAVPETLGQAPGGGIPGLLVPAGDAGALAGAIRLWLSDDELRRRLRDSARRRRDTLSTWDESTRDMVHVLATLRE